MHLWWMIFLLFVFFWLGVLDNNSGRRNWPRVGWKDLTSTTVLLGDRLVLVKIAVRYLQLDQSIYDARLSSPWLIHFLVTLMALSYCYCRLRSFVCPHASM